MKKLAFIAFLFFASHIAFADEPNLITAVSSVAQKVGPAVVAIKTERTQHYGTYSNSPYNDELFNQFFEDLFGGVPQYEQKQAGLGSGVIIDGQGYILTNNHVVNGADTISVSLPDGRKFDAQLIGVDARSDLAVIKMKLPSDSKDILPVASLGNSENLQIGQWVVAIGNPFGNVLDDPQPTVTSGVISALHRALPQTTVRDSDYSDLIQTDAAINPGNSGGPLVNLNGEVIGINVAIFSTSGGYQGVGFAIPVNYAKAIVDQLIQGKKIEYGYIGVGVQDIDERLAAYFNLTPYEGVLVNKVVADSPAEKAGVKEGDMITSVNKIKVRTSSALLKQISNATIGKTVILQVLRDQKILDLNVVIGQRSPGDSEVNRLKPAVAAKAEPITGWRGLTVSDVTQETAKKLNLANTNGVIISEIASNSPAQRSGLQKGDVIIAINKQPIYNLQEYQEAIQKASGSCLIRTVRGFFVLEP